MPPQRPKAPSIYCHESRPITFTGKQSWIRTIHRTLALAKTLTLHVIFRHLQGRQLKDPIYVFFLKKRSYIFYNRDALMHHMNSGCGQKLMAHIRR